MRLRNILIPVVLLAIAIPAPPLRALADADTPQITTTRFQIFTDFGDEEALELASHLAQLHALYGQFFAINPRMQHRFNIRYFATKSNFDSYLIATLGRTYPHFVFLDYDSAAENELLLYPQGDQFDSSLAHFAFLQFIQNNIPHTPLWIREGYARYVENSSYNPDEDAILFRESVHWLEPLREIILKNELIDFAAFFGMNEAQALANRRVFYPQAWGMISFFISYRGRGRDHVAREINSALSSGASESENIGATMEVISAQFDLSILEGDFREYILSKESFENLVAAAIAHYEANRLDQAERSLQRAIALDERNHVPYYYLGLINYDRRQHGAADHFYVQALTRGADGGTVYYALGLNALVNLDRDRALIYFDQARIIQPSLFGKIEAVLRRSY